MKVTIAYYRPPSNAVFRESPVMVVYHGNNEVFRGKPIEGVWVALDLLKTDVVECPNEAIPTTVLELRRERDGRATRA